MAVGIGERLTDVPRACRTEANSSGSGPQGHSCRHGTSAWADKYEPEWLQTSRVTMQVAWPPDAGAGQSVIGAKIETMRAAITRIPLTRMPYIMKIRGKMSMQLNSLNSGGSRSRPGLLPPP